MIASPLHCYLMKVAELQNLVSSSSLAGSEKPDNSKIIIGYQVPVLTDALVYRNKGSSCALMLGDSAKLFVGSYCGFISELQELMRDIFQYPACPYTR